MAKRVTDVSNEYRATAAVDPAPGPAAPASDKKIAQIRRLATRHRTGQLERNVDAVLAAQGLAIDQPLEKAVKTLGRQPFGGKQAAPFQAKASQGRKGKARRRKK